MVKFWFNYLQDMAALRADFRAAVIGFHWRSGLVKRTAALTFICVLAILHLAVLAALALP